MSEQGDLAGGQCKPLLPGTEHGLHMDSHHTTQLQTLWGVAQNSLLTSISKTEM